MINLLPPELKDSYGYARRNVRLIRWLVAICIGFIGLVAISTAGIVYMQQTAQGYVKQLADASSSLQQEKYTQTQTQVQDISTSLKLAVQVLSKEILFSKLLTQLATIIPSNAVLAGVTINQVQTGVDITALTTDYATATQLQVNLADPSDKVFTHADIISIVCNTKPSDPLTARYPCTITIRALFASNNPFLLINDKGTGK